MWNYEKRLQYPVKITRCDPKAAMIIASQYGGPDGEIGASMRYLSQRYSMENRIAAGTLTDIGTEELAHLEMVATIICQLTKNLTPEEIKASGFDKYYIDHTLAISGRKRRAFQCQPVPEHRRYDHRSLRRYGG